MENENRVLIEWATKTFSSGCYLGDLARSTEELGAEEMFHIEMAREGYLTARSEMESLMFLQARSA